jgi:hypothetical protein
MEPLIQDTGNTLLSQGVLGIAVIGLVYFVMMLRAELKDVRAAHKVELAEKDKLIHELHESRLAEARVGFDLARTTQSTMDAFLVAMKTNRG